MLGICLQRWRGPARNDLAPNTCYIQYVVGDIVVYRPPRVDVGVGVGV